MSATIDDVVAQVQAVAAQVVRVHNRLDSRDDLAELIHQVSLDIADLKASVTHSTGETDKRLSKLEARVDWLERKVGP